MSYYGLGYNHSFSVSTPEQLNQEKVKGNISEVDALMTTYMQQCVDYHEEQKKIEAREQEKQSQNEDIPQVVTISYKKIKLSEPVNFVAGDIQKGNITKCSEYISNGDCKSIEVAQQESSSDEPSMVDPAFVKALHTAQEIAKSFNKTANLHQDFENAKLQYPFAEKRNEFMTGHKKMLHNRFIQNLDYLAKQDEEKLKEQMSQLQSIQEIQAKRQQILLEQKQKRILLNQQRLQSKGSQCVAGIGSKQRKGHEKKLEKSGHMTKSSLSSTAASCAVYISGLPTDFNIDPSNSNASTGISSEEALESILHGLFSSFGKISSLKLYREMSSRKMKGDGLISYDFSSIRKDLFSKGESYDDIQGFLKSVCSQVSDNFIL